MNAAAPRRQAGERCEFRGTEHLGKFRRQGQHLTQMCQRVVGLVQLHVAAEADVLICCEHTLAQERLIVIGGKAEPGEREIGQRIVLMRQSRVGDALQVARAAAGHAGGFQHRHGNASTGERKSGVCAGQSCSKHQRALWRMRRRVQIPRGDRGRRRTRALDRPAEGIALATKARPFIYLESRCSEASPDIPRRREGRERGLGPTQASHRVIEALLPGARFPRRRKAIEIPGIDPGPAMAG